MKLYHGTPFSFSSLLTGSWLTTSKEQTVCYLLLKNAQIGKTDLIDGFILELEVDGDARNSSKFEYIPEIDYFVSREDIPISPSNILTFRDEIPKLHGPFSSVKAVTHLMDLTEWVK